MSARDRFKITIKCTKCGDTERVDVSEDDHRFIKHPGFRIDSQPQRFVVLEISTYSQKTKVKCAKCDTEFYL